MDLVKTEQLAEETSSDTFGDLDLACCQVILGRDIGDVCFLNRMRLIGDGNENRNLFATLHSRVYRMA